jgi:hypothetical protein
MQPDDDSHGRKAECGCPRRIDGTEPYLHREGCPRSGELQTERWLRERSEMTSPTPVVDVICHGHDHTERHGFNVEQAALLLEWFSGEDWTGGPRCTRDILVYIREQDAARPPLARR